MNIRFTRDAAAPALLVSIGDIEAAIIVTPDAVDVDADDHAFEHAALHAFTDRIGEILGRDFTRGFDEPAPDEDTMDLGS